MDYKNILLITAITGFVIFFLSLIRPYGFIRAHFITLFRLMWILPIILSLTPKEIQKQNKTFIETQEIEVLIDDSVSMKTDLQDNVSRHTRAMQTAKNLERACKDLGCRIKMTPMSQISDLVKAGYSPISESINKWLLYLKNKPAVIITDGQDYQPYLLWHEKITLAERLQPNKSKQIKILGFEPESSNNLWIEHLDFPRLGFHTKKIDGSLVIKRSGDSLPQQSIQIQIISDNTVIATQTSYFLENMHELHEPVTLNSLQKGKHLLTFKVLPSSDESSLIDNFYHQDIEILPNTTGILHLLGNPSWDGRFLRRYLKSEPKYDLVSFFILRNPGDKQESNERELSLIPFPVGRLFTEELPNFHIIIMQNFSLLKFLQPQYQRNLVNFVKQGGGLLFLGGEKSFNSRELRNSPLQEIFPFTPKHKTPASSNSSTSFYNRFNMMFSADEIDKTGPWFEKEQPFQISLASPTDEQKSLATVYEKFYYLKPYLEQDQGFRGIHHLENIILKNNFSTPLLTFDQKGSQYPLALASYPEKGRAIWFFTDSLWKLALNPRGDYPRNIYNEVISASLTWLLREEAQRPLTISSVKVYLDFSNNLVTEARLEGSALKYMKTEKAEWSLFLCQQKIPNDQVKLKLLGNNLAKLTAHINHNLASNRQCHMRLEAEHDAFGSTNAEYVTLIPQSIKDKDNNSYHNKLSDLARILGADLSTFNKGTKQEMATWLKEKNQEKKITPRIQTKTIKNFYWIFDTPLLWLLFIFMPLEVLVRKWNILFKK